MIHVGRCFKHRRWVLFIVGELSEEVQQLGSWIDGDVLSLRTAHSKRVDPCPPNVDGLERPVAEM